MMRPILLTCLVAQLFAGLVFAPNAFATRTVVYPSDDVAVEASAPNTAGVGSATLLYVGGNVVNAGDFWATYLKFNLSSLSDVTINSATLYMLVYDWSGGSVTVSAHEVTAEIGDWSESAMSWSTATTTLTVNNNAASSAAVTTKNTTYTWNLTAAARNHQGADFSVCLKESNIGQWVKLYSKDCGTSGFYPYLDIDYTEPTTRVMGWENMELLLGMFGNGNPPVLASSVQYPQPVHAGARALRLQNNSAGVTPRAFVAHVTGLQEGDRVSCRLWRHDLTPGVGAGCRLRAHWSDAQPPDPYVDSGDAGGNPDMGPGAGWDETSWGWSVNDGHVGLVIECEVLSEPGDTVWLDDLMVNAPPHATVELPCAGPTAAERTTWGRVKVLYR